MQLSIFEDKKETSSTTANSFETHRTELNGLNETSGISELWENKFEIEQRLTVKQPSHSLDPESYYYLLDYAGASGYVINITRTSKGIYCYELDFGNKKGVFYEEDLV